MIYNCLHCIAVLTKDNNNNNPYKRAQHIIFNFQSDNIDIIHTFNQDVTEFSVNYLKNTNTLILCGGHSRIHIGEVFDDIFICNLNTNK